MQYYGQYEEEQSQYYNEENIRITLQNEDLWNQFHQLTNEMIVTKIGRRMFPIIAMNIRGLDPDKMYTVELSFEQIDSHRWRYISGQWQAGTKPDPPIIRAPYQHPDSPNYGRRWMQDPISFPKVKLTNKIDHTANSQVILNSLHKYQPKISIIDVMSKKKIYETSFEATQFIAVTAYQNEEVKSLKIRYNPFAKAFLDSGNVRREMLDEQSSNGPIFSSQESSSGGPDRIKLESYRSSPYTYIRPQRRSSPTNAFPYPSSSTSPFDYSTTSANNPCSSSSSSSSTPFLLSDNTAYYSNSYYPPTSSYYFPYGSSPTTNPNYSFMPPFNYNYSLPNTSTLDTSSFLHMQPPMAISSNDNYHLTPLLPITTENEEY